MKLLRYEAFVIETSLTMPEAVEKLRQNVEPKRYPLLRLAMFWIKHKIFEGTVSKSEFRINPITRKFFGGFYLPILMGHLEPFEKGTKLIVSVKPYPPPWLQMLIGIGCVIATGVGGAFENGIVGLLFCLPLIVGAMLFFYGSHFDFMDEARCSRTALENIFAEK